jgi:hypothetical protein
MGSILTFKTPNLAKYTRPALMDALVPTYGAVDIHIGAGKVILKFDAALSDGQKTAVTAVLSSWAPLQYAGENVRTIEDVDRAVRKQINEAVGGLSPVEKQLGMLLQLVEDVMSDVINSTDHTDLKNRITTRKNNFTFFTTRKTIVDDAENFKTANNITT